MNDETAKLPELQIVAAFHVKARKALADCKSDGLIDEDFIATATAEELQVLGPSLTLFFAAVENTTNPPSVQIPAVENYSTTVLSISTCPVPLLPLFRRWQQAVEPLQALSLDNQHDVARLICDLEPVNTPVRTSMIRVAADLQQIAIQLAQRETYLQRYASDLQVGLGSPNLDERAQPPPTYSRPDAPPSSSNPTNTSGRPLPIPPASPASIPITEDPGMMAVRETLYAALADVLYSTPSIGSVLRTDPPRGYFTAVALAIQQVALTNLTPDGNRIRIVGSGHRRNASFGVDDAPEPLRVFAQEIIKLGAILKELQAKDDEHAIHLAVEGLEPGTSPTNMELLQSELEHGADSNHEQDGVQVAEIRSIANHIGRIALAVTRLPGFRDRSGVFEILLGVMRTQ